mmetsp:Transcript_19367/g.48220  ORF Transcript_19367/g.48220 Transcript_19367/m.48220 type:complete len:1042 (-) Transcript_19367:3142-6267(-)
MSLHTTAAVAGTDGEQQQAAVPNAVVSGDEATPSWRIFVKTVGKGFDDRRVNGDGVENKTPGNTPSVDGSLSFHVTVNPEDRIDFLHDEIEGVTGVKASQQRLIYRGRLIGKSDVETISHNSNSGNDENDIMENTNVSKSDKSGQNSSMACKSEEPNDYKIKDIVGLCDGQTIHLVRKRESERTTSDANSSDAVESENNASNTTSRESETSGGGSALLAALLGLDSRFSEDGGPVSPATRTRVTNGNTPQTSTTPTNPAVGSPWRSSRSDADAPSPRSPRHHRRPHYRLGSDDLQVSDPGSMESVRQGLMTLNTIMNSQPNQNPNNRSGRVNAGEGNSVTDHPLEVNREWFRGQWIDARDTVNQWLEATVVDILDPRDVLNDTVPLHDPASSAIHSRRYGSTENPHQQPRQRRVPNVDNDPAISANDLEGRRRLLLEECEPGDPREITIGNTANALQFPVASGRNSSQSFRPRSSNDGVKLLLIHYNGWPHRWDEWIRSDSERLRPFRTRTRHPNSSTTACPTPQSNFNEAPRTNICENGEEEEDRFAVLPELNIALSRVSELLGELVQRDQGRCVNDQKDFDENELEDLRPSVAIGSNPSNERAKSDLPWMARKSGDEDEARTGNSEENISNLYDESNRGREAEHVSNNVFSTSEEETRSSESGRNHDARTLYSQGELRNLATLFDRLGRTLTDVAPHIASAAASLPAQEPANSLSTDEQNASANTQSSNSFEVDTSSAPLGGLLSLWSRERERARRNNSQEENTTTRPIAPSAPVDPDHIDFASGIVNTTRGEVRSGPRSRASHQDDVASLLGTYLAAASLGSAVSSNDENGSGATSSLARLLQRGAGGGSGDNGIDIHIHAIVTAPGVSPGGMGIATLTSGGSSPTATLGGARNILSSNRSSIRADGGILRTGTSLSSNFVEPSDEEDYNDLFSELYSESPTPIDPNGSPTQREGDSNIYSSADGSADDDGTENNYSPANVGDNSEQLESPSDAAFTTPPSNRRRSSQRRESASRRSGVFRLFRRRNSRPGDPNNEEN